MDKHIISSKVLETVLQTKKNNHGAEFTLKSKKTGKDYTYKIERSEYNGTWYTHVKVETNYLEFKRLGTYFNGKITLKHQLVTSPSAVAIAWILQKVEQKQFTVLDEQMEVMHLGNCLVCGRTLTDSESIRIGLGPICRNRH